MSIQTWGMLPKSQDDNETIEEAINRLIQVHDDDETSHLGTGQSLQSHKASEIIDHLASSIVNDKLLERTIEIDKLQDFGWNRRSIPLITTDGWSITGSVSANVGDFVLQTGSGSGTLTVATAETMFAHSWLKDIISYFTFKLLSNTNQTVYVCIGSGSPTDVENQGVGFKISNGTLYAYHSYTDGENKTEVLTEIAGIAITNLNRYQIKFFYGVKIEFYVNDVLKATHSSNLPSSDWDGGGLFTLRIINNAAENKALYVSMLYTAEKM